MRKFLTWRLQAKAGHFLEANQFTFRKICDTRDAIATPAFNLMCERSLENAV